MAKTRPTPIPPPTADAWRNLRPIPGPEAIIQVKLWIDLDAEKPTRCCLIHYRDVDLGERVRSYNYLPPEVWSRLNAKTCPGDPSRIISQDWYRDVLAIVAKLGFLYEDNTPEVHE